MQNQAEFSSSSVLPKTLQVVVNTIVHMMAAIVLFVVWNMAISYYDGIFQLHILFSVTGYQLLMFEAILVFNKDTLWAYNLLRENKKIIHLSMQLIGSLCAVAGGALAIAAKSELTESDPTSYSHFDSAHGICGLIAMILSILSLCSGALAFYSFRLDRYVRPVVAKALHNISGCTAIIMGLVTLTIGANKEDFIDFNSKSVSVCVSVFVVLNMTYLLVYPMRSLIQQFQNMKTTIL